MRTNDKNIPNKKNSRTADDSVREFFCFISCGKAAGLHRKPEHLGLAGAIGQADVVDVSRMIFRLVESGQGSGVGGLSDYATRIVDYLKESNVGEVALDAVDDRDVAHLQLVRLID